MLFFLLVLNRSHIKKVTNPHQKQETRDPKITSPPSLLTLDRSLSQQQCTKTLHAGIFTTQPHGGQVADENKEKGGDRTKPNNPVRHSGEEGPRSHPCWDVKEKIVLVVFI
ncbi:hypothetical protein JTE90_015509 [Oedothorax gibbosus]|uniref:Uncharacterized protein n=1 Tax=Oedothorax gibbosus TaxID=931172 RepID=A0AAV6VPQ0_9ARAC|nr:hypothetical protein JTE90_015509 [Oedothorax gibbosus]